MKEIDACIESIFGNIPTDELLNEPLGRLHFAAGYLADEPEISRLLNVIITGQKDSPASDQTKRD